MYVCIHKASAMTGEGVDECFLKVACYGYTY